ncbi:hypothetical protein [Actinomadura rupiterrae]|uniref:hypothetical protein n=1 Tax=Actinomadura rupiterrae TaxID=559627 RepID=UPI0020A378A0|nr:hypothetical protein [Actinomadura rupiterrae]MCP2336960.1 hypothetical protein [Actinomadura rupiterrae]
MDLVEAGESNQRFAHPFYIAKEVGELANDERRSVTASAGNSQVRCDSAAGGVLGRLETEFRQLATGPGALLLDGCEIGEVLPSRPLALGELRAMLLGPETRGDLKDLVWAALVRRARADGEPWVTACVGMALPGLRAAAARNLRHSPERLADDVVSEMLTEFLAQLPRIDLDRPRIATRLLWWGRKGALRERGRGLRVEPRDPHEALERADQHETASDGGLQGSVCSSPVEPADLLGLAIRQGIIRAEDAELIRATRLQGQSLRHVARGRGEAESKLYSQRERAEARLATAMASGQVSARAVGHVPNSASGGVLSH